MSSDGATTFMQRLFGKPLTPDELCRKWRQNIRAQDRLLDRQVRGTSSAMSDLSKFAYLHDSLHEPQKGIQIEEQKFIKTLKEAAKRKDQKVCRSLAKELVHSRKARDRLITSKAQLNSIGMQLQQQMCTRRNFPSFFALP